MAIDQVDSELERRLDYAFSPELGYLTACPTNLGTGIRVSAMLHLPGLVLAEQINQIIQSVNKLGLAVRGLYGEGTEALGNVFQVSNQMTLGEVGDGHRRAAGQGACSRSSNTRRTPAGMLLEKKPKMVYQSHWPGLRHPGQCAQHHLEGDDEPAVVDAAGHRFGAVSGRGPGA